MKKGLFILSMMLSSIIHAQSGLGVKAGLNYGDNGKIEFEDISTAGEDVMERRGENKTGYHLGVFYRAEMSSFYVKPELLYTRTKSFYEYNNRNSDYNISKLDLPVLIGTRVIGPIHIFAGPSLQYILDNEFEGISLSDVENEFTVGAQFGAGIRLGSIDIDARYERGLTENQAKVLDLDNPSGLRRVGSRPNQFILSLSLNL